MKILIKWFLLTETPVRAGSCLPLSWQSSLSYRSFCMLGTSVKKEFNCSFYEKKIWNEWNIDNVLVTLSLYISLMLECLMYLKDWSEQL